MCRKEVNQSINQLILFCHEVLKLLQASRRRTPDEFHLVCIELESVGLHSAHDIICTCYDMSCKVAQYERP